MNLECVEVVVPDGVLAGDAFLIEFRGQQLSVVCPKGCRAGDPISFEVNVVPDSTGAAETPSVEVTVPDGCKEGMEFTVHFEGRDFNILVPEGCGPGSVLLVEVPAHLTTDLSVPLEDCDGEAEASCMTMPLPAPDLADGVSAEPYQVVVIQGLKTKPWLNGERATLISWDGLKGRWLASVGGGSSDDPAITLALKPENLRSQGS